MLRLSVPKITLKSTEKYEYWKDLIACIGVNVNKSETDEEIVFFQYNNIQETKILNTWFISWSFFNDNPCE